MNYELRENIVTLSFDDGKANASALGKGEKTWETEIDGVQWNQRTFPYQAKCLGWINEEYRALDDGDRDRVDALWAGTGCESIIVS